MQRNPSYTTGRYTLVSGNIKERSSSPHKCEYSSVMKVKVTPYEASLLVITHVLICAHVKGKNCFSYEDVFLFTLSLVCRVLPPLHNSTPHDHPSAPSVSAWFSCNLSVPALYSWNTLTTEPFISHPRRSSHTWHTWWALKGAAAMWGWFALHLVPPHPYRCPIYLYNYNPDPPMRHPQMSGWALSCLLLTSSVS